jgi:hypothetical protein
MRERLLPWWQSKLSAADATAHALENPFVPSILEGHEIAVTLFLVGILGAVFLKGFKEAIGIAVLLVFAYLSLNFVVIAVSLQHVAANPSVIGNWREALTTHHGSPIMMVAVALLVFPLPALGLSGLETGVAVMPLVAGGPDDTPAHPVQRIRNTQKLLTSAAIIMSLFLITSSIVTTLLIPHEEFEEGGASSGSLEPRRWRGCSTSCSVTSRVTAWLPTGRTRRGRW